MKPWKKTEPQPEKAEKTKEEEGESSGDGEDGSGEPEIKTELKALRKIDTPARFVLRLRYLITIFIARWAALPFAVIILVSVFGYIIFKSEACMCSTWFRFGAKEAL